MKFYTQLLKLLVNKIIFQKDTGTVIKKFCESMGIVYIKLAQILATQNYKNMFTEEDRQKLSSICDECNPVSYEEIEEILKQEYGNHLENIFSFIEKVPTGYASVSQVHRAILKNGKEVAIKIKRKDITKTIEEDIKRIKSLVHRLGKLFRFSNFTGGDYALNLYLSWIKQETDFKQEIENIKIYQNFAKMVNGKVKNTKDIKVPLVYEKYCTENIIVMEFIKDKTINKMPLTEKNQVKIAGALNSYIKSSFWAMFNEEQIVFHGDPHSGNIYIDQKGNIGFLDMGLIFSLTKEDSKLIKIFFLTAYTQNVDKLYNLLVSYGQMSEEKKKAFKEDCQKYCKEIREKDITYYFTDMINICLNYEFVPPKFLFCMAKAFICLNGINRFSNNKMNAIELLKEQTTEYLLNRSIKDCYFLFIDSLKLSPKLLYNSLEEGLIKTVAKEVASNDKLNKEITTSLENLKETLEVIKLS